MIKIDATLLLDGRGKGVEFKVRDGQYMGGHQLFLHGEFDIPVKKQLVEKVSICFSIEDIKLLLGNTVKEQPQQQGCEYCVNEKPIGKLYFTEQTVYVRKDTLCVDNDNESTDGIIKINYCPMCGAKLEEVND